MVGNFRKCRRCGKIFNFMGNQYCPDCLKKKDEDFAVVRKYIYENPDTRAEDIAEATGVKIEDILDFLKEGRLQLKHADGLLTCEKCGTPIATGRMCEKCRTSLNNELVSSLPQQEEKKKKPRVETSEAVRSKLYIDIHKK